MNITEAEAIVTLHGSVVEIVTAWVLQNAQLEGAYMKQNAWCLADLLVSSEGIEAHWSRYIGCGEYENETTNHSLSDVFN